eukprot:scaffold55477_cov57-Attheya_sp.AAC.1
MKTVHSSGQELFRAKSIKHLFFLWMHAEERWGLPNHTFMYWGFGWGIKGCAAWIVAAVKCFKHPWTTMSSKLERKPQFEKVV